MTARAGKTQKTTDRPPPTLRSPTIVDTGGVASVHLTLAVCDYEHVREIAQGLVRADGITLTPLIFPSIEEITFRFTKSLEWDVSELSFGKYISLTSQGIAPMVAIPVFPSRVHRHSAIYVRGEAGIRTAKDLEGRAVGIPEWRKPPASMCAAFSPRRRASISRKSAGCRPASTNPDARRRWSSSCQPASAIRRGRTPASRRCSRAARWTQ